MKIQHIQLSFHEHFLVVDGVRGPLASYGPATHPAGLVAYHPHDSTYGYQALRGKVFQVLPADQVESINDTACEPATEAFKVWQEVVQTCTEIKLARYGVEAPKEKP